YGDYDCDGVCASVIMLEALKSLGAHAEVYIPSRKEEGYGLNTAAMHKLAEKQYRLMITVDCGITAVEEIALAKSLGMNVILTDHHTPPDPLPAADAILHPQLGGYPCSSLCGAGTAYKLACALSGKQTIPTLPLCALATVADMVPLLGENRTLAALGLAAMADTSNIGLRALLRVSGLRTGEAVTGQQAGFLLAPRINACGRMETAQIALELLSTDDPVRAAELADTADGLNARRKSLENQVLEQANAQASALDLCTGHAIVIEGEGWESGVVGLAAGRLAEYYGYPTVILSREGDICVGSARSACGVDLYQALSACSDLFTRFGGHKQAAGLTLPAENVPELRIRLSDAVAKQLQGRTLMPETVYDGELRLTDITLDLISSLGMLEPFGTGNPAPVFLVRDVEALSARAVGSGGSHLKLTLGQDTCILDAIAFRMGTLASSMRGICSLAITPVANTFNGRTSPECRIEAIASMQRFFSRPANEDALAILQELAHLCRIDNFSGLPAQLGIDLLGIVRLQLRNESLEFPSRRPVTAQRILVHHHGYKLPLQIRVEFALPGFVPGEKRCLLLENLVIKGIVPSLTKGESRGRIAVVVKPYPGVMVGGAPRDKMRDLLVLSPELEPDACLRSIRRPILSREPPVESGLAVFHGHRSYRPKGAFSVKVETVVDIMIGPAIVETVPFPDRQLGSEAIGIAAYQIAIVMGEASLNPVTAWPFILGSAWE
ncbi:MAG: single-stranded-DNA-specific exonuclease RecJ, partial [Bacteroidales bacterium]|nr:single-stranded-DNA-specific exonuclease RecJ [Bacteroidales bacterium]